jgi:hypothetical protein
MTLQPAPAPADDVGLTPEEFDRDDLFEPADSSAEDYPCARNVSGAFMFRRVVRALEPVSPEYVTVPISGSGAGATTELFLAMAKWNMLWEAAQFRRRFFAEGESRPELREAAVWRHLIPCSPLRGFSASDPIKMLAHNLDFWVPPVTVAMEEILRSLPVDNDEGSVPLDDGTFLDGAVLVSPRGGTELWRGEVDAAEVVRQTVEAADTTGRLRGILDAVRSNRVEDDFSDYWSFAREDFERKLYRKRAKVKVRFVELTDTVPVQGA